MPGLSPLWILVVHAGVTCALTGLIWLVQVVHYPLFAAVDPHAFPAYHREHTRLISLVVGPLMIAEAVAAIGILAGGLSSPATAITGVVLLAIVWAATFGAAVPRHDQLAHGFDATAHASLVATNWIRTAAWSARAMLSLVMVANAVRLP